LTLETLAALRVPLLPLLGGGFACALLAGGCLWRRRGRRADRRRRRESGEQHLRLLLEQLPVVAWSVDPDLRIVSAAGSGLRELRVRPGDVVGRTLAEAIDGDAAEAVVALHERVLAAGESASGDASWRQRDFRVRVEPLRAGGGEIAGCVGLALDVTEQLRREAAWSDTQRLESLGVLAGGIAHDLANLLGGVLGHAELALLQVAPGDAARAHLEQAIEGAHRGGDLTRQLLAYAGRGETRREAVDLGALVRGMGDLLRVALGGGCELRYELLDDAPAVEADAAQLRQVVMNLITNGAEAIGDAGGTLHVVTSTRRMAADELAGYRFGDLLLPGEYVALRVSDTGAGMTDEVRSRIFEPFFSTKRAGRGLGLAAVLGIVRGHGGALRVDSAPGRGTTFEILLPARRLDARLAS